MYKLYQYKNKQNETVQFALFMPKSKQEVTELVKKTKYYEDPDLRTLKEIPFPNGELQTNDLEHRMYYIFLDGELHLSWNDNANSDCPEDLCWSREIKDLIKEARKLERAKILKAINETA